MLLGYCRTRNKRAPAPIAPELHAPQAFRIKLASNLAHEARDDAHDEARQLSPEEHGASRAAATKHRACVLIRERGMLCKKRAVSERSPAILTTINTPIYFIGIGECAGVIAWYYLSQTVLLMCADVRCRLHFLSLSLHASSLTHCMLRRRLLYTGEQEQIRV